MTRFVGAGRVESTPEWTDCCWPNCLRFAEGGGPPLCQKHYDRVIEDYNRQRISVTAADMRRSREEREARHQVREAERQRLLEEQSQVYYVRIGDHVKIGYTVNLKQRLIALRVSADAVLATEPGGRIKERERHLQFAAERIGRREDFNPSRRLLAHIDAIKTRHGEPNLTTYPRVDLKGA